MSGASCQENLRFRILVADDEQDVLDAFRNALVKSDQDGILSDFELDSLSSRLFRNDQNSGAQEVFYDLVFCRQGEEAVEAVQKAVTEKNPFSIAFLDVRMPPGITGVLAGERIRKMDPNINIVLVTGYTDINPRDIAELIPPPDKFLYFQKPFNRMEIQQLAVALSAKWKVERELLSLKAELELRVIERDQALTETNRLLEEEKFTRRRYRDSLRVNRFELKAILSLVQAGIVVVDTKTGSILDANEHALEIMGVRNKKELLGHPCSRFLCHGKSPVCLLRDPVLETGAVDQTLFRMDGTQIPIRKSAVRVHHGEREVILETFIDVSREVQTQVKLAALEHRMDRAQHLEAVSSLTQGIAHDFNNILQALLGYTEEALHHAGTDKKVRDSLEWILKRTQAAKPLVAQLQALSGQTEEERKSIRPELLLRQTLDLVRAAMHPRVQLIEEIHEPGGAILAEITRIHKVLEDIINLAQKTLGASGGQLSVSLDEVGWIPGKMPPPEEGEEPAHKNLGFARVTVRCEAPDGMEIPKEADDSLVLLDSVQEVLLKHDGHLEIRTEQPNQVVYLLYLPLIPKEQPMASPSVAPEIPLNGSERLLFVDNDEALTHLAVEALGRLGYRVDAQTHSRQAVERFCQNPANYDVVITDLTMPELTGYALAKRILQVQPSIPIILCTAHSNILNERLAHSIGISKFLCKPYLIRDLARTIREALQPPVKRTR
jgi:PAS domain S-box-containing protein